jgi:hypothetical protein
MQISTDILIVQLEEQRIDSRELIDKFLKKFGALG